MILLINLNLTIILTMLKTQTHNFQRILQSFSYQSNQICNSFGHLEEHHIASLLADIDHQQLRPLHPIDHTSKLTDYSYEQPHNIVERTRRKKGLASQDQDRNKRSSNPNGENKSRGTWAGYFNWSDKISKPFTQLAMEWDKNADEYEKQFENQMKEVNKNSQPSAVEEADSQQYPQEQQDESKEKFHELKTSKKSNPDVFSSYSNQLLIKFNPSSSRLLDAPKKTKKFRRVYRPELQQQVQTHRFNVKPYGGVQSCSQNSSELVH